MKKLLIILALLGLSACSELELGSHFAKQLKFPSDSENAVGAFKVGNPYMVKGRRYTPKEQYKHSETGIASWYGPGFHGKQTANGEIFNKNDLTAAHRTLQLPSIVRVTNLQNGKSIIVRVNDRGPFAHDRVIDLSEKAADILGMKQQGTAKVRLDVLGEESRIVANAARDGISTRGTEIALNRGRRLDHLASTIAKPTSKPFVEKPAEIYVVQAPQPAPKRFDNFIIKQANAGEMPPPPSAHTTTIYNVQKPLRDIYIQTGAFSSEDNAMTMKMAVSNFGEAVNIQKAEENGSVLYKVKMGPFSSSDRADEIVRQLNRQGRDAKILMAQN